MPLRQSHFPKVTFTAIFRQQSLAFCEHVIDR